MKKSIIIALLVSTAYVVNGTDKTIQNNINDTVDPITGNNIWIIYSNPNIKHNTTITGTLSSDTTHH